MSQSEADLVHPIHETDLQEEGSTLPASLPRTLALDAYLQSEVDLAASQTSTLNEIVLSEEQLRELYDNEEIERFLHLFSAYVTELQAPETPDENKTSFYDKRDPTTATYENQAPEDSDAWTPLHASQEQLPAASRPDSQCNESKSISEEIANRYIVPNLPPSRPSPPFTLSRLRLATERLYLAIIPVYGPFIQRLYDLASWEDPRTSCIYCFAFWTLWWYNLIAPTLVFRVLFSLLKRRVFPYPSLEDLRQHREELLRADKFGEQVSARLSSKASNMKEIWRLFKLLDFANKSRLKAATSKLSADKDKASADTLNLESDQTIPENVDETQEVQDLKRIGLQFLEELADLHERIHNISIWRRSSSSRLYGMVLSVIFLMSFLPTQYIAKAIVFSLGFVFWHVTPIILALHCSERRRLPPPFADVPTDAEYAMELISQRLVSGLDITPSRKHRRSDTSESADLPSKQKTGDLFHSCSNTSIDWKKWGDRMAIGKSAINDIKRLKPGQPWVVHEVWPPRHPLISGTIEIAQPQIMSETHTYPCQHCSTPGLLTLTHSALLFTPLMSQNPKLVIPLTAVKGVKKAGLLKGLNIRWNESVDGLKEQKEDKFAWIGSRDELFARLVGSDAKRWMKV